MYTTGSALSFYYPPKNPTFALQWSTFGIFVL
jgi:hypothetical protein